MILFHSRDDTNVNRVCIFDANCSLVLGDNIINHVDTFYLNFAQRPLQYIQDVHNVSLTVN